MAEKGMRKDHISHGLKSSILTRFGSFEKYFLHLMDTDIKSHAALVGKYIPAEIEHTHRLDDGLPTIVLVRAPDRNALPEVVQPVNVIDVSRETMRDNDKDNQEVVALSQDAQCVDDVEICKDNVMNDE